MTAKGSLTAELIAILGPDLARRFIRAYAGAVVYIPRCHLGHPLVDVLGEDGARALCQRFGGSPLLLPLGRQWEIEARNESIRQARREGATVDALVKEFGLSQRQIHNILKGQPAKSDAGLQAVVAPKPLQQLSLF